MPRRTDIFSSLIIGTALALSACATPRLHTTQELNHAGTSCGLAAGELVQEHDLKRVLIFMRVQPTPAERACVYDWTRRNHLKLVVINSITRSEK